MSPVYEPPPDPRGRALFWGGLLGAVGILGVVVFLAWGARGKAGPPDEAGSAAAAGSDSAERSLGSAPAGQAPGQIPASGEARAGSGPNSAPPGSERTTSTPGSRSGLTDNSTERGGSARTGLRSQPDDARALSSSGGGPSAVRPGAASRSATSGPAPFPPPGGYPRGTAGAPPSVPNYQPSAAPATTPIPATRTGNPQAAPAVVPPDNGSGVRPEVWSPGETGPTGDSVDVPAEHADRETDRAPPVLDGVSFDPTQIDDGTTAHLMIRVHDDLAGIRTVTGNVRSPSARAVFPFEATQADASSGYYVANINIPAKAETGGWYLAYLYVPDRADNALIASYTPATVPPGGTLNVHSRESDSVPPVVHDVVLTSASVQGGERNHMRVDVDDDASGVASVVGSFKSPSGSALIPFVCRLQPDSQTWEGDVIVPQSADCGQWTVNQVIATDKAANASVLQNPNPTIQNVGFQVVGSTCDDSAPVLDTFSLNPTTVTNESASEIVVTANLSDTGSGTSSMTGWATGPPATNGVTPKVLFACVASSPSDPGSTWTGKIIVPQYAAKGTWRVTRVRLQDRAQNTRDYTQADPILANAIFIVQ